MPKKPIDEEEEDGEFPEATVPEDPETEDFDLEGAAVMDIDEMY